MLCKTRHSNTQYSAVAVAVGTSAKCPLLSSSRPDASAGLHVQFHAEAVTRYRASDDSDANAKNAVVASTDNTAEAPPPPSHKIRQCCRRGHRAAYAIALLIVASLSPGIAQAQVASCPTATASQETVCNLAEADSGFSIAIGIASTGVRLQVANAFTTGDATDGYILQSVRLNLTSRFDEPVLGAPGDISVAIHAQAAGGRPADDPVENGMLSGANPTGRGGHDFTARNVVLARNATYFLVVSAPDALNDGNDNVYSIGYTRSTNQAGSSGWSIGDRYYFKENDATFIESTGIVVLVQHFAIVADTIGIIASETEFAIDEAGANKEGKYTLALLSAPTADVLITPSIASSGVATFRPPTLTFTRLNWSATQTVTVTAIDDSIDNLGGQRTATITHAVDTTDVNYAALADNALPSVEVTVADDDDDNDASAMRLKLRVFLESALP